MGLVAKCVCVCMFFVVFYPSFTPSLRFIGVEKRSRVVCGVLGRVVKYCECYHTEHTNTEIHEVRTMNELARNN